MSFLVYITFANNTHEKTIFVWLVEAEKPQTKGNDLIKQEINNTISPINDRFGINQDSYTHT